MFLFSFQAKAARVQQISRPNHGTVFSFSVSFSPFSLQPRAARAGMQLQQHVEHTLVGQGKYREDGPLFFFSRAQMDARFLIQVISSSSTVHGILGDGPCNLIKEAVGFCQVKKHRSCKKKGGGSYTQWSSILAKPRS